MIRRLTLIAKAFDEDKGEDARRPPADRRQDAELGSPLVDRHDHGVGDRQHGGDQNDGGDRCGHRPDQPNEFEIAGELAGRPTRKIVGRGCQSCPYSRNPSESSAASIAAGKGHGALAPEHLLKSRKRNNGNVLVEHGLEGCDADDREGLKLKFDRVAELLPSALTRVSPRTAPQGSDARGAWTSNQMQVAPHETVRLATRR